MVAMIRAADLAAPGHRDADAFLFVTDMKYRLMRTQEWTPEVLERLRAQRSSVWPAS